MQNWLQKVVSLYNYVQNVSGQYTTDCLSDSGIEEARPSLLGNYI